MKRTGWFYTVITALTTASLWVVGCGGGGDNGVGPDPDPYTTGPYGMRFTVATDEGNPASGIPLKTAIAHITSRDTTYSPFKLTTVENGEAIVDSLSRGIDYGYSLLDEKGNPIPFEVEGQVVSVLILRLDEGEDVRGLYIPLLRLLPKVVLPSTGTIHLESTPSGARVFLGEVEQGTTPLDLELDPGTYKVRLVLEGYEEVSQNFFVIAGKTEGWYPLLVRIPLPIDSFPTEPTAWIVIGIFSPPEKFYFWRVGHAIWYTANINSPTSKHFEVGTITDEGVVEIRVWRSMLKGQFYPDDMEIRGEAGHLDDPSYHAPFIIRKKE